jgi:crotonobetainyl-CoA:carnitine CoA-transferase CaiB-like acyl-CoA transferase
MRLEPIPIRGSGPAARQAAALARDLGGEPREAPGDASPHDAIAWARSGAMALTGRRDGPPRVCPGPLASRAAAAASLLDGLSEGRLGQLDGPALLGERAAILGLRRRGTTSPGGSCRLLRARDGYVALNLARPDDRLDLPAWLSCDGPVEDPFDFAAPRVADHGVGWLCERAHWLGLPVARAVPPSPAEPWLRGIASGAPRPRCSGATPLVVDLSSLWAGPLCTRLLHRLGARVVKVESVTRPDGARRGPTAFFDLMNAGKQSVALDFGQAKGRDALRRLVDVADVVVESARPRALAQLGIDAAEWVAAGAGRTWVSITGYGRGDTPPGRVAFGDDAAVAAGLAIALAEPDGTPLFCGDAIADPLTGLHAAVAAYASWRAGGGHLLDLSLRDITAHALGSPLTPSEAEVRTRNGSHHVHVDGAAEPVRPPRSAPAGRRARPLGADTAAVLRDLSC